MYWYEVEVTHHGETRPVARLAYRGFGELVEPTRPHRFYESEPDMREDMGDVIDAARAEVEAYAMMHDAHVYAYTWDEETDEEQRDIIAVLSNY